MGTPSCVFEDSDGPLRSMSAMTPDTRHLTPLRAAPRPGSALLPKLRSRVVNGLGDKCSLAVLEKVADASRLESCLLKSLVVDTARSIRAQLRFAIHERKPMD